MNHRIFVANRGEIAVRIIEACDRLGYDTVLGVSSADKDTLAARRAGRVLTLGGPRPADSYLNMNAVVQAALSTGCTAVHPGYGFLSERPAFAELCAGNGLTFAESVDVPVSAGGTHRLSGAHQGSIWRWRPRHETRGKLRGTCRGLAAGIVRGGSIFRRRHRVPRALRPGCQACGGPDHRGPPRPPGPSWRAGMFGAVPVPESH